MTLDASLTVIRPLLHRQPPPRRNGGTVFRQHPGGVNHCSPAHPQQRGRFPSSKRMVQICTILLLEAVRGPTTPRACGVRLNGRPLQFPRGAMEAAKPGSRSRSTKVFCGWQGRYAPRRPSSRRPSRFFRPRVPRTEHALSNLEPIWPQRLPASPPPMPDPRRCL